jgi:site-specific DNA-methyltransferase (adenine-specific)
MADASVDSIVTDPPYGLSFMGKRWDYDAPSEDIWRECLRVLKPGGHLLAFAGTRTQHRMAARIEDAGFEIRDMIAWVYGSGFPKSLDVSKAIDKAAGAKREVIGHNSCSKGIKPGQNNYGGNSAPYEAGHDITSPATDAAKQWDGWGTALKPALEPITVARKPLIGTVAENVIQHGTGGLNIDGCRVPGVLEGDPNRFHKTDGGKFVARFNSAPTVTAAGRWPANFTHDGDQLVMELFPSNDTGSAARFFYCAKASKKDRDEGCQGLEERISHLSGNRCVNTSKGDGTELREFRPCRNHHPTVKPTALMRYLCRLVTPREGTVLDPFMGSGSTGKAAVLEGFNFIGIEREAEYVEIAKARIGKAEAVLDDPWLEAAK